jgi:hypothetical protein
LRDSIQKIGEIVIQNEILNQPGLSNFLRIRRLIEYYCKKVTGLSEVTDDAQTSNCSAFLGKVTHQCQEDEDTCRLNICKTVKLSASGCWCERSMTRSVQLAPLFEWAEMLCLMNFKTYLHVSDTVLQSIDL